MFVRVTGIAVLAIACGAASAWADCDAKAHAVWAGSHQGLVAEAVSQGATCENAVVTLVVRDKSGKPLWVDSRIGAQVMVFADIKDKPAMKKALGEWIDQNGSGLARTDKLPDWPNGAQGPKESEFPFYPETQDGIDREMYMRLRAKKLPMFCYVQGMESMACVALDDDGMTKVGVQSFPG
ncbi:MAG: hypothetical protein GC190_13650 [Alphaproteobacteria bacterium]|nr:hypothetical protein [Alphaproteobacteria bacterium]